jgi:hypothetical protein
MIHLERFLYSSSIIHHNILFSAMKDAKKDRIITIHILSDKIDNSNGAMRQTATFFTLYGSVWQSME